MEKLVLNYITEIQQPFSYLQSKLYNFITGIRVLNYMSFHYRLRLPLIKKKQQKKQQQQQQQQQQRVST